MLDNNIDWCDVDSDEEYCIPLLPPLPLVDLCFPLGDKEKEEPKMTCSSGTLSETSEPSSSTAGSCRNSANEVNGLKASDRLWSQNDRVKINFKNKKTPKYDCVVEKFPKINGLKNKTTAKWVCFIGKFPKLTTIDDMISFVKSTGINFTEIRMGPKRNPKKTAFGYVDLPTKKDYDKLLTLDGSLYKGRRIRVDRANRKKSALQMVSNARKVQITTGKQTDGCCSRDRFQQKNRLKLQDFHSNPIYEKKIEAPRKPSPEVKRVGCNKATARSRRWKRIMYNQKRGQRYKHMYVKTSKDSAVFMNCSSRSIQHEGIK